MEEAIESPNRSGGMPNLEIGMQELEAMEAPGWATWAGFSTGTAVSGAVAYGSAYVAVSGAAVT